MHILNTINTKKSLLNTSKLSLLFIMLFVLLSGGYLIVNSYDGVRQAHEATIKAINDRQLKRDALAAMLSSARERSLIMLRMTSEEDVFELDDLSQQFSEQARIFITARNDLLLLPLTEKEKSLLDELDNLVKLNSPKQNNVVKFFIEGQREQAINLLFDDALPGQNTVMGQFVFIFEQYNKSSISFFKNMDKDLEANTQTYILMGGGLFVIGTFAIVIILTRISRKEEQKLSQVLEQLAEQKFALDQHAIVAITDNKGVITYANDRLCKISGYTRDEIINQHHRLLNTDEKGESYNKEMYDIAAKGKVWSGVVRNKTKDGDAYWVNSTIVPFIGKDNTPRSYISIQTDITKQKLAGSKVRASEERFRDLADLLPTALFETDENLNITYANRCTIEMFGISNNDLKQNFSCLDLFSVENKQHIQQAILKSMKGGNLDTEEYLAINKNGITFPVILYASSITKDNTKKGIRGVIVDISERKQSEIALRRSQKMDAVGQLTGGIAHDFNNILNIILGNLELLKKSVPDNQNTHKRIQNIDKSTKRAAELTRQLLSFSRHQAENVTLTNINQLISDMESLITHSITPQVEIKWQLEKKLWSTKIAPGDFEDALLNLIINARDAMSGSGQLSVETSNITLDDNYCRNNPDAQPGDYVRLTVSDCGEGIAAGQLEHIFEPFFTTKDQGKGTGLGLAMVFGFMNRSKGHIKVKSVQNHGATFHLYLPRSIETAQIIDLPLTQKKEELPEGNETVLIVDDEEALLELAEELLQDLGYHVLTAINGKQALEVLTGKPNVDLMISDVIMPGGINGYELAEQVTSIYPKLKVLLASGYTEKISCGKNRKRFSANLLEKPYSQIELAQKVREQFNS